MTTSTATETSENVDFFTRIYSELDTFTDKNTSSKTTYSFQGLGEITCIFGSTTIQTRLSRAMSHLLTCKSTPAPACTFHFVDEKTAGFKLPPLPWHPKDIGEQGVIKKLHLGRFKAVWQFGSDVLYLYDAQSRRGLFWTYDVQALPHWELSFPLRYPITWGFEDLNAFMVHAGAVGNRDGTVLIVGKSGSGKSTTSISALKMGMNFFGDDYVLADIESNNVFVHSLFNTVKVDASKIETLQLNHLDSFPLGGDDESTKRVLYCDKQPLIFLKNKAPLTALIYPQITTDLTPSIEPMSPIEMLRACAPSTLFQIPCNRNVAFKKMTQLVRMLPSYRFRLTPNLEKNAAFLNSSISDL